VGYRKAIKRAPERNAAPGRPELRVPPKYICDGLAELIGSRRIAGRQPSIHGADRTAPREHLRRGTVRVEDAIAVSHNDYADSEIVERRSQRMALDRAQIRTFGCHVVFAKVTQAANTRAFSAYWSHLVPNVPCPR